MNTAIFEGKGDIAAEERPTLTIGPNRRGRDRVLFEADEEHWHGAAPNRLMLHLPINEGDADHDVVHGLDCVTDKEYAARPPLS